MALWFAARCNTPSDVSSLPARKSLCLRATDRRLAQAPGARRKRLDQTEALRQDQRVVLGPLACSSMQTDRLELPFRRTWHPRAAAGVLTERRNCWRLAPPMALLTHICLSLPCACCPPFSLGVCLLPLRSQGVGDGTMSIEELADLISRDEETLRALAELESAPWAATYTPGESRDEVLREFSEALAAAGYSVKRSDSTAAKYVKYMKFLFDNGVFLCRSDFFVPEAYGKALAACEERAAQVTRDQTKRTGHGKLVSNYMHGFDDYVRLCKRA
jgi:hypothetical protein